MRSLLLCLLLFNATATLSQKTQWFEGSMVLKSNQVLSGRLIVEPVVGVVVVEKAMDQSRHVFNAHQIREVYFHDEGMNINRRFISLCENSALHHGDTFFEVVLQGEVFLLRRQKIRSRHLSEVADFDYYTWYQNRLFPLRHFSKSVYPVMAKEQTSLVDFKSGNLLHPGNSADAIRLIEFYNRSVKSAEAMAMQ